MPTFVSVNERLEIVMSYSAPQKNRETDIELPAGYCVSALIVERDASGNVVLRRNLEAEPELFRMRMQEFRIERNHKLTTSDWSVMPDNQLTEESRNAWIAYRQILRDLPSSINDLSDLVQAEWPQEPTN